MRNKAANYRTTLRENFLGNVDATVVISPELKSFLKRMYLASTSRLYSLVETKGYDNLSSEECYIEHNLVKEELNKLNIFSEDYKFSIVNQFYFLIDSFSPRHD